MTGSVLHSIVQVGLALALMVGLIFSLAWLAKKTRGFGLQGGKHITLLQTLPLGQKEKAVLIELEGNRILLGVTANQVSTLWSAPVQPGTVPQAESAMPRQAATNPMLFSDTLKALLGKKIPGKDETC